MCFVLDVNTCRALDEKILTYHAGHIGGQPLSDVIFDSSFAKTPGPSKMYQHFMIISQLISA
jgi:hypothetical protein